MLKGYQEFGFFPLPKYLFDISGVFHTYSTYQKTLKTRLKRNVVSAK